MVLPGMTTKPAARSRLALAGLLGDFEKDAKRLFSDLAQSMSADLYRFMGADGKIPPERSTQARQAALRNVTAFFLARTSDNDLGAFEVRNGEVIPLSPYFRLLWKYVRQATEKAVQQHADIIANRMDAYPNLLTIMRGATVNPFVVAKQMVSEQQQFTFKPDPLAKYDPLHQFVYAGRQDYRLSDRIWDTNKETRRKLDVFMQKGIAEGRGALDLSGDLELFLHPGRLKKRTKKPYGKRFMPPGGASYDAMRLARTEISAAGHNASLASAQLNPFVTGYTVRLSGSHPCCDICDLVAAEGPYPKTDTDHLPPLHPHCLCTILWEILPQAESDALLKTLAYEPVERERNALLEVVTPLIVKRFTDMLLAEALPDLFSLEQQPLDIIF